MTTYTTSCALKMRQLIISMRVIGSTDKQVDKTDILGAVYDYLHEVNKRDDDHFTWGDGDSLDRERVRDILVIKYGYDKTFYGGSVLWEDFANEN